MIYNDFKGLKISALGMGTMRLPVTDKKENKVDIPAARELIDYALKNGINYFDTAYGYHNGTSEPSIGEILSEYPRDSFYLASKFPGYNLNWISKIEEIFPEQLERCRVDYFDFYLYHNVNEENIDEYLNPANNIHPYLLERKAEGKIRHLGFSAHGNLNTMKRFLEAYGSDMEFCQLQINWLDWNFQSAKEKVELVSSYGIPVFVMEPVRGGSLLNLDKEHEDRLRALRPNAKNIDWCFNFLQSIPEVVVTLSVMSNMQQLSENIKIYEQNNSLSQEEMETILNIAFEKTGKKTLPCTACKYCISHCPQELDIPWLIELYNEDKYSDGGFIAPSSVAALEEDKKPMACISCRSCEAVCPQSIRISEVMADFSKRLKK